MSWIIDPFIFSYLQFNHQAYLSLSSQQAKNIFLLNKIILAGYKMNWFFLQFMVFSFSVWPLSFFLLFYFYSSKTLNMIHFSFFLLLLYGFHRYFVFISSHRFDRQVNNRLPTPSTLIIRPYTLFSCYIWLIHFFMHAWFILFNWDFFFVSYYLLTDYFKHFSWFMGL